jgi:DNA-binding response OmpR family regulator
MSSASGPRLRICVYSDDRYVREQVRLALGTRPAPELPAVEIVECATHPMVIRTMDRGDIDLAILDGDAVPAGGMGICRQLKAEIFECPPILILMGREQDAWLASWSQADRAVLSPPDPLEFPEAVAALLRQRLAEHASAADA